MNSNVRTITMMASSATSLLLIAGLLLSAPAAFDSLLARGLLVAALVGAAGWTTYSLLLGRLARGESHYRLLERIASLELDEIAEGANQHETDGSARGSIADRVHRLLLDAAARAREAEHRRSAAEVRAQQVAKDRDEFQDILEELPEPLVAINAFGELRHANRAARSALGIEAGDIQARGIAETLASEELVKLLEHAARCRGSAARSAEIDIAEPEGSTTPYRVVCRPLAGGGPQAGAGGVCAVLHDLTERRTLQRRHAEFVSAVSHEMKTPLAGIKAYVELLADGDAETEEEREEFLGVINSQADRLQRLIDNLLNLARIEAGVVEVHKEHNSLNGILEEALHVVQPSAERKQIRLRGELSPLYLGVHVDRDMILQAAINLLSNAIKYTPEAGEVTLRSRLQDEQVLFEVADTGVGLTPEDSRRVFEKFYRVKKDRNMAAGTGLGLPLAKHIVEDVHGGRLSVTSSPGAGSTFQVQLPPAMELVAS